MSIASFAELDEASNIFVKFLFNLLKKKCETTRSEKNLSASAN